MRLRKRLVLLALAAALPAATTCRRAEPVPSPAAADALHPRFEPPVDGLLTDRHLDLYVKVRRASRDRSESDAARALGVDPDEFAWVRARIVEALVALDESRVREAAAGTYARAIASLRETLRSVRDSRTARTIEGEIAGLERERAGMRRAAPVPPEIAANARKIEGRRAELESVSK